MPKEYEGATAVLITAPNLVDGDLFGVVPTVWVSWERHFNPGDGRVVYHESEIRLLKDVSVDRLRKIHAVKSTWPGARVVK